MRPLTICVLTYGDYLPLVQRCLESIVRYCPREQYRLLAGASAPSPASLSYLQGLERMGVVDKLIVSEENINKCPMMRRLFELADTEFIWWFDDDSWLKGPEPFVNWLAAARQSPASTVMWGHLFYFSKETEFNYGQDIVAWVKAASWYKGKEPPSWRLGGKGVVELEGRSSGDGRWFFATGGCWLARKRAMEQLEWPDRRLIKAADDVMLGEAIRQQGWHVRDMGAFGLAINDHARRGDGEGKSTMARQTKSDSNSNIRSEPKVIFQIPTSNESPEQLEWCLYHLRMAYPESVVILLSETNVDYGLEQLARKYKAAVFSSECPGKRAGDAAWWRRFFIAALEHSPDFIVRLDPRTKIWSRFSTPKTAQFFGTMVGVGSPEERVHGGCQCFGRRFADSFAASEIGLKTRHFPVKSAARRSRITAVVPTPGSVFPAIDAEIARISRMLGYQWEGHPEFCLNLGSSPPETEDRRYAVTHPHPLLSSSSDGQSQLVEVVIMNWRRPANVRRIVEAFAAQAHHCRITVIDSSPDPEFALDRATLRLANRHFIFSHNFGSFNRFVLSLGLTAEYTLFHDDDLLPGREAIAHLLACAQQNSSFSVMGEFGRYVSEAGEELVQDAERTADTFLEVDFLVRSYFVRTAHLRHLWNSISELKVTKEGCEDDLLLCASIQQHTGFPCLVTPCGAAEQSLACEHLPEPFALWHRNDHFERRARFIQVLIRGGWKPMATNRPTTPFSSGPGAPIPRMIERRHAVVAYRRGGNLGDAMQAYAITRLLPGRCSAIYRDEAGRVDTAAPLIMNGWLGLNPGAKAYPATFAGIFIGADDSDNLRWMISHSSHSLIGARDPFTQKRLESAGIPSAMIGCATLTLPRYSGERRGILHIDDDTEGCLTQRIPDEMSWEEQWQWAELRIRQLARAAAVYTARLHIALPCLALGTPVCFYPRGYQAAERFSILEAIGAVPGELAWKDASRQAGIYREFLAAAIGAELADHDEPAMPELEGARR